GVAVALNAAPSRRSASAEISVTGKSPETRHPREGGDPRTLLSDRHERTSMDSRLRGNDESKAVGVLRLRSRGIRLALLHEVQRDVDDHVFLTADHTPCAELDQDRAHVQAVVGRGLLGMAQEARIHAGVAEAERL